MQLSITFDLVEGYTIDLVEELHNRPCGRGRGTTALKPPRLNGRVVIEKSTPRLKSGKGQIFSEEEIKILLHGLYEGKEKTVFANDYVKKNTSRTKQSLKVKIQSLQMECLSKMGNSNLNKRGNSVVVKTSCNLLL